MEKQSNVQLTGVYVNIHTSSTASSSLKLSHFTCRHVETEATVTVVQTQVLVRFLQILLDSSSANKSRGISVKSTRQFSVTLMTRSTENHSGRKKSYSISPLRAFLLCLICRQHCHRQVQVTEIIQAKTHTSVFHGTSAPACLKYVQ